MNHEQEQFVYLTLIKALFLIACNGQTEPDGNRCAICYDNDHQAWECRFNAFNQFKQERRKEVRSV